MINYFKNEQPKCECWNYAHTVFSIISEKVERKSVSECTSGGGFLQYTECKCKLCGRVWDEQ
jgi:hypothetical protein